MSDPHGAETPTTDDDGEASEVAGGDDRHALVRVHPPRRWDDPGVRMVLGACYFAWLGYLTALLPLLLLNLHAVRRREELAYNAYASVGWSLVVAAVNAVLLGASVWAGTCEGPTAEAVCNAASLIKLVLVLAFALLMSLIYGTEVLIGRRPGIPWISAWAHAKAQSLTGGAE